MNSKSTLEQRFDLAFNTVMDKEAIKSIMIILKPENEDSWSIRWMDPVEDIVFGYVLASVKDIIFNQICNEEKKELNREESLELIHEISQLLKNKETEIRTIAYTVGHELYEEAYYKMMAAEGHNPDQLRKINYDFWHEYSLKMKLLDVLSKAEKPLNREEIAKQANTSTEHSDSVLKQLVKNKYVLEFKLSDNTLYYLLTEKGIALSEEALSAR